MRVLFVFCLISSATCLLEKRIKRFDKFHHDNVKHHITKRDIYSRSPENRGVEVDSLGRKFKLNLKKHRSLFTPDFRVVAVDDRGQEKTLDIDPNLYHGTLENDKNSKVQAYFDDSGSFMGTIRTEDKKYAFEPSWRHLPDEKNITMIFYEESDVDFKYDLGEKFCEPIRPWLHYNAEKTYPDRHEKDGESHHHHQQDHYHAQRRHHQKHGRHDTQKTPHVGDDGDDDDEKEEGAKGHSRSKRSVCTEDEKMICSLMLVADYKFFVNMGNSDFQTTTGYLISVIDNVNQIYNNEEFGNCGKGFGFEIREIKIHNSYSSGENSLYDYNLNEAMNTSYLLERFGRDPVYQSVCLAHLFTYTSFSTGVLGLAYIAYPRIGHLGGICSSIYSKGGSSFYTNTGWSTSVNKYNRKLLTVEAYLVTSHELGHNWGSEHDPDNDECSPHQGKYIMYMYSVSGREENNKKFSPCSRRAMAAVIKGKASYCFKQRSGTFCGNFKVEEGEECDEGQGVNPDAGCCDRCKLKEFSQCSDINHQCCENCRFAHDTKTCLGERDLGCKNASRCSGVDTTCIPAANKPNGTDCGFSGKCISGKCLSICEYHGKLPCICGNFTDSCKWCCKESKQSVCLPHENLLNLPEGTPCYQGFCNKMGDCLKQEAHNSITRLWKVIESIDANKLVMFMKANIVGTVIIFSLVIWIPASCAVAYVDRKRSKSQKEEYQWYQPDNNDLLLPWEDESNIRRSSDVKVPPRNRTN